MVVLGGRDTASQTDLERLAYDFARRNGSTGVPISALGDPAGPPGYRISPEAQVTILFFRSGKVLANRAYASGEWNQRAAETALRDVPRLLQSAGG
jgi:hypothetical protein